MYRDTGKISVAQGLGLGGGRWWLQHKTIRKFLGLDDGGGYMSLHVMKMPWTEHICTHEYTKTSETWISLWIVPVSVSWFWCCTIITQDTLIGGNKVKYTEDLYKFFQISITL